MAEKKLTKKQKLFVELYLQLWKPSEAARRAGYKQPDTRGGQLMRQPQIAELIDQRMNEISMKTDEVITRLTQQARVNLGDFLIVTEHEDPRTKLKKELVRINWEMVKKYGYLIRELSWSKRGDPILKLHDAQSALTLIGKARRMFVDQVEETHHLDQANINIYLPDNGRQILVESSDYGEN